MIAAHQLHGRRQTIAGQPTGNRHDRQAGATPRGLKLARPGRRGQRRWGRRMGRGHDHRVNRIQQPNDATLVVAQLGQRRRIIDRRGGEPFVEQFADQWAVRVRVLPIIVTVIGGRFHAHDPPVHRLDPRKIDVRLQQRHTRGTGHLEFFQRRLHASADVLVGRLMKEPAERAQARRWLHPGSQGRGRGGHGLLGRAEIARAGKAIEHEFQINHSPGHRTNVVEVVADRHHAVAAHSRQRRLARGHAAIGRGTHQRSASLRAQRPEAHARRHRHGRPATAAAGRVRWVGVDFRVPRVAARRRIETGKLDGDRLAQDDRPGAAKPRDDRRVLLGQVVLTQRRAGPGRQAGHVDDVLDAHRHAVQRAAEASLGGLLGQLPGRLNSPLMIDHDPSAKPPVEPLDPIEALLDEFPRRYLSPTDLLGRFGQREWGWHGRVLQGCHCWLVQQCFSRETRFALLGKPAVAPILEYVLSVAKARFFKLWATATLWPRHPR